MKPYGRVDMYMSTILDLGTTVDGNEWSASLPGRFTPRKKSSRYTLDRRLGGLQIRSGHCGTQKNILSLPVIEPLP
jgi:hypothetical protein